MQEEKENIQGERVLLRYDQLPTNNLKIKCNAKKIIEQPGHPYLL